MCGKVTVFSLLDHDVQSYWATVWWRGKSVNPPFHHQRQNLAFTLPVFVPPGQVQMGMNHPGPVPMPVSVQEVRASQQIPVS